MGFIFISSCKKEPIIDKDTTLTMDSVENYDYQIIHEWNNLFLELERYSQNYRPCPSAHFLGYYGIANYEACVSSMSDFNSMSDKFKGLSLPDATTKDYHWPSVINRISFELFNRFFDGLDNELFTKIDDLYLKNEAIYKAQIKDPLYKDSKDYGTEVALSVWNWMETDEVLYQSEKDPFRENNWMSRNKLFDWQPTNPNIQNGLYPYFGKGRTMVVGPSNMLCRSYKDYVGDLSENNTSAFYAQVREVLSQRTPSISFNDRWNTEFWYDDMIGLTFSTVGRWLSIGNQIMEKEKVTLDIALWTNAALGIALHDAAIGIWSSKYHYNLERPISFINRNLDPNWIPAFHNPNIDLTTPSYPLYPSAQAGFAGAASEVLSHIYGFDYGMTDRSHEDRPEFFGMPMNFSSLSEMARASAWSRVTLGVNYRMDTDEGLLYGTRLGREVATLAWRGN